MAISSRPAFSFIEVLFAVILLGIGFIMIAGVFPVAIQQAAAVSDETQGMLIARDAVRKIQAIADGTTVSAAASLFQPTLKPLTANGAPAGTTVPVVAGFCYSLNQAIGPDAFYSSDRRFGWVGFYRRDSAANAFAQVTVVSLENPNFPNYITAYQPGETTTLSTAYPNGYVSPTVAPPIPPLQYNYSATSAFTPPASGSAPALLPVFTPTANAALKAAAATPPLGPAGYTITLEYDSASGNSYAVIQLTSTPSSDTTGAYLIVADDGTQYDSTNKYVPAPLLNGRILRLGSVFTSTSTATTYLLQPGFDLQLTDLTNLGSVNKNSSVTTSGTITSATVDAFIIGRAPALSSGTEYSGPFTGPNQDIAATSAFIRINTANN